MRPQIEEQLSARGISLQLADNGGPMTLRGTNSWVVQTERGSWVIDPGPNLDEHLDAIAQQVKSSSGKGALAGIVLTHKHGDHSDGVDGLLLRLGPAEVWSSSGWMPPSPIDGALPRVAKHGEHVGPFEVFETPGHSPDHIALIKDDVVFTGDAVLGYGSTIILPGPGSLSGYLASLQGLKERNLSFFAPGHGPAGDDPSGKFSEYIEHRLQRERRLIEALDDGLRSTAEILDRVWDDAPGALQFAAAVTLETHLGKLEEEGRLPEGVERGDFSFFTGV